MKLEVPVHKKCTSRQEIDFTNSNCLTLIGENGSGKSSILESVFKEYSFKDEFNLLVFSSGQNESFSEIYGNLKEQNKKYIIKDEENIIKTFYFNPRWSNVLIFFATAIKEGLVRDFLREKKLVEEVERGENSFIDISTRLYFQLRVNKTYLTVVENSLEKEKLSPDSKSIRRTFLHRYLEKLLEHNGHKSYDFDNIIVKDFVDIKSRNIFDIFIDKDIYKIFSFFSIFEKGSENLIDISESNLLFKNGIELTMLSDGEFQLLTIYALIDLFDKNNTIFLFDEVDSHLHYKNLNKLWHSLKGVEGKVITTTHIADSIVLNGSDNLKVIDNGIISQEQTAGAILKRLENLSHNRTYQFHIASKFHNIALVENFTDWFIFKELCKIKINNFNDTLFQKVQYINCSSGYDTRTEEFANNKISWYMNYQETLTREENRIKNLFMICDRDNLPLNDIKEIDKEKGCKLGDLVCVKSQLDKKLKKIKSINTHLLSWRRREIENYLLSKTMLESKQYLEKINNELPIKYHLKEKKSMDDIEYIQSLDIKSTINTLYTNIGDSFGVCYKTLADIISLIPKEEISDDIEQMYMYLEDKVK